MQQKTVQILSIAFFAALLLWGFYTLFVYMGVNVHMAVLLTEAQQQWVKGHCVDSGEFCHGFFAMFPLMQHTIARAAPFLWYGVLSLVAYGALLLWQWMRHERLDVECALRPWKIFAGFLISLWLIFTILSSTSAGDAMYRRLYEPLPQVYVNVGEEGMNELKNNFNALLDRGCLRYVGQTNHGAGVYDIKAICMQGTFFARVLPLVFFVLAVIFELLVFGRFLLFLLKIRIKRPLVEGVMSVALGACGWIVLLWTAAVAHVLFSPVGWALAIGIPLLLWRHSRHWLRQCFSLSWSIRVRWYDISILLAWLLISYLALNFLNVVRPFPIGWDDLGSYLNRPRMMVSYGHFVHSMSPFQWEYLTSLGYLLFGFDSTFGATASMMVNWMAGVLAIVTVFAFTNMFLGRGRGLLAAFIYYTLPLVGHFSYADMKIDNAVFTMGALSVFALFLGLFPPEEEDDVPVRRWLMLTGILCAFAFAIKSTSAMVIFAIGIILVGASLHWSAFVGAVSLGFLFLSLYGVFDLSAVLERSLDMAGAKPFAQAFLAILGFGSAGYGLYHDREKLPEFGKGVLLLGSAFFLCIAPWIIHNNILLGNVIPHLVLGAPNTLSPQIGTKFDSLPDDIALDLTDPACTPTGTREELDRYWGFDKGWRHYVTLPWRVVMNTNATGYYVTTMPALLLFPLLILLPYFWTKRGRWLRWLFIGTLFMLLQWMLLANGIPWYGIGIFFGLAVGLEALVARSPDVFSRMLAGFLIFMSLFVSFGNRFWQFELQKNLFEYPFGKISAEALRERTIPHYDDIADVLVQVHRDNPDRPYLFRVGTFIPYFIPRNLEIIGLADHQLDTFNCLFQERDRKKTLARLKALGFSSIIFDTNTATIEQDPRGSLHQKVQAFVDFLNDPEMGWQVLVNDPDAGVAFLLIP